MAALFGLLAFIFAALLGLAVTFLIQEKGKVKAKDQEMLQVRHKAQLDLARFQGIADLEKFKAELESKIQSARVLLPKFQTLAQMEQHKAQLTSTLEEFNRVSAQWQERISAQESTLAVSNLNRNSERGFFRRKLLREFVAEAFAGAVVQ